MKIKFFLFMSVIAVFSACKGGGGRPSFGDNEYPVLTVSTQDASMQTTYPATLKGIQDVEIRPKVSGFITRVCVKEGQQVSAGQLLFVIDSETYQATLRQAQAAVNTARSQMNTAKLTFENSKELFNNKIIGQFELQTAQNTYQSAAAQLAQAQASLASAKEMLSYCYVKSPAAGVIGSLPFKVGALVSSASQLPLTTVSNTSTMEVFFSMTEKEVLDRTQTAGSTAAMIANMPAVKLKLSNGEVYQHPGKVVKMSGIVDASTGSVSMIAHFSNPNGLLKSGASGSIILPHDNNRAIVIPQTAAIEVQNKLFVYLVGEKNKVKYTEITVDPQNDGKTYVVTGGIKVGDRIVSAGQASLTDGMEIVPLTQEQYQQKLDKATKLGASQGDAAAFAKAMSDDKK